MSAHYAIETQGLSRSFGDFIAVKNLSLQVPMGSFFGFLGPNGAGKSTTIKMLTGLLEPSEGEVRVFGENIQQAPVNVKRAMGVVPEKLHLFESLSALEYLEFSSTMYGVPPEDIPERSAKLLAFMNLEEKQHETVGGFSHGMRKKIALAAALMHQPRLLFLDEPFEGLDVVAARSLQTLLKTLTAQGMTIFLTSHILEIVEKLCDHVAIIQQGELVVNGTMKALTAENSLENAFLEVMGTSGEQDHLLSWLSESS